MACNCSCNCAPVNCSPCPVIVQLPNVSQSYTFENAGLTGVGVFDNETNYNVQFRNLVSNSLAFTISLDAPNKSIVFDFDADLLISDIPTATETERGVAEIATQAETNAGVVDNVIVTPLKLAARTATETRSGILEIATQAEVTTGTNDSNAVTPLKLATWWSGIIAGNLSIGGEIVANGNITGDSIIGQALTIGPGGEFSIGSAALFFLPLSFETGAELQLGGSPIVDAVLVGRTGGADQKFINEFISTENVQTGYTTFSNPAVLRTCDTATVTLPQLAQIVGTLIEDLKAVKLPAT